LLAIEPALSRPPTLLRWRSSIALTISDMLLYCSSGHGNGSLVRVDKGLISQRLAPDPLDQAAVRRRTVRQPQRPGEVREC
jgi:hypothetical protein